METFRVTRRFSFDSAHRLPYYDGPCKRLHGHHYVIELIFEGNSLDEQCMLVDFANVKELVKPILDEWDHKVFLFEKDGLASRITKEDAVLLSSFPTAEALAKLLWQLITSFIKEKKMNKAKLATVRLYETPDCWAEYSND